MKIFSKPKLSSLIRNKIFLRAVFSFVGLAVLAYVVISFKADKIKRQADADFIRFISRTDPSKIVWEQKISPDGVRIEKKDGFQYGLIQLENNSKAKYWFVSQHQRPDKISKAVFLFENGLIMRLNGHFYSEVYFGDKMLRDEAELITFIKEREQKVKNP